MAASGRWEGRAENGKQVRQQKGIQDVKQRAVKFVEHAYTNIVGGGVRCLRCNGVARTANSRRQLDAKPCGASLHAQTQAKASAQTDQQRDMAVEGVLQVPTRSQAVEMAPGTAKSVLSPAPWQWQRPQANRPATDAAAADGQQRQRPRAGN